MDWNYNFISAHFKEDDKSQRDSTEVKVFTLHIADLSLISGMAHGPGHLTTTRSEHWEPLGINYIYITLHLH